jgi:thymidylate synthase (FAD)
MEHHMRKVLDHGYVRIVDHMGSDLSVVRAARVSHSADWRAGEDTGSDSRLIRYLWRNRHTTPFEAVTFTFEVKAPIFVVRQWHRHRTWSFNEVSARYTELPEEFYVPDPDKIGEQSTMNKQGRDIVCGELADKRSTEVLVYKEFCAQQFELYQKLLECGWPRELARMVLPLSTYTRMFATVNLLNLFKFIRLRNHEHAQWEMQQYAQALEALIEPVVPECHSAFVNYPQ